MSGSARLGLVAGLLALATAADAPAQRVLAPTGPVRFGEAFELVLVSGNGDGGGAALDERLLRPLVVERRLDDGGGAASRDPVRYQARCYQLGEVTLPLQPPHTLTVTTSLPEPPGELEFPGDGWLLEAPGAARWWPFVVGAVVLLVGVGWTFARRRAPAPAAAAAPVERFDPLAALRALPPASAAADAPRFCAALKELVRRHCGERYGVPAAVRTSEELVAATGSAALADCLRVCDAVLFGAASLDAAGCEQARQRALAFAGGVEADA